MNSTERTLLVNEKFFDITAEYYDSMVNFETALKRRSAALKNFIKPEMKTAADLGCGTGLDSISLSINGLKVTGFDISQKMITKARKNTKHIKSDIRFYKCSIDKIPGSFNNKFDCITSLGNTLANLTEQQLVGTCKKIYKLLKPGGSAIIQILNYDLLLKSGERIVKISQNKNFHIVRFYDFMGEYLNFNILKYSESKSKEYQIITTRIYPHKPSRLKLLLKNTGFTNIRVYDNFDRDHFDKKTSKDVIITFTK